MATNYSFILFFAFLLCFSHTQLSILAFISNSAQLMCIQSERQALLNFKHGLFDYYGILSTWSDDDNNRDCCKWKGIQCNNETGHVHMLDLRGQYPQRLRGSISITSLIDLQNIQHLDLSNNDFEESHIPELIGSFTNLRYLNLSSLYFSGRIPSQLGNLSQLRYLDLHWNSLDGTIPSQLGNLSQLRYLDLQVNSLKGTIPSQLGKLTSLRYLKLVGNYDLKINDAKWLSSLSSLTTLGLTSFPNLSSFHNCLQMISQLIPNMRELRLDNCGLSDDSISYLFPSHSNHSTPLSILDLSDNMLTSATFQMLSNYSLNLKELYLSDNNFVWPYPHFRNFPSLVILDLSYNNNLTASIFQGNFNFSSELREFRLASCGLTDKNFLVPSSSMKNYSSSLVTLDLSSNLLKSSAIFQWLSNFTTNLQSLNLQENLLEGSIPDRFGKIMNSLENLDLSFNKLQGKIPVSLGNICTLHDLDLSSNNLSQEISSFIQHSSWCNRHVLQTLDLSYNQIIGMLPNLSIFNSLRTLFLSNNRLTGDITESHLNNLSKLEELDLTDNSLSLKFGTTWVPPFQLSQLGLGSCKLGPSFPNWLQNQNQLWFLDISDAGIDDFVPDWFWKKLQFMGRMNMSYNSLKGKIPNLSIKRRYASVIILNSNKLEGGIPAFLSQANTLDLSNNKISTLHTFLCGKSSTAATIMLNLDLSNNQIMGDLPDCWEHLKSSLRFLDLSNNKLSGKIPQSMGTLVNLEALVLRNNSLTGDLPFTLKNCTSLVLLDVSINFLSGPIPSWIGESLQQLKILSLRVNHFLGSVPVRLCYLKEIHLLDLSRNNLSGGIPTCLRNFTAMVEMSVIRETYHRRLYYSIALLTWKGQDQVFLNPEIFLKSIDLSSNDLKGEIPKEVGYLLGLVSLNLARNNLNGQIPSEIGNLNQLDYLDLSRNHLSGRIPSTLSKIDGLGKLDLSNNNLSGRIPWEGHLQTFEAASFEGNVGLCGQQLNKSCPGDETTVQPQGQTVHGEDDNSIFYEALYMSLGLGFFTGFWSLLGPLLIWKPLRIAYVRFLNRLTDYILVTVEVNVSKCCRSLKGLQHKI